MTATTFADLLFDRSPRFLRLFDLACALASLCAWGLTGSLFWALSATLSVALAATGATWHLQRLLRTSLRRFVLALLLRGRV